MSELTTIPAPKDFTTWRHLSDSEKSIRATTARSSVGNSDKETDETLKGSEEGSSSLDIKLGGLSSSSSLSWSDEYTNEVTKKINDKLRRMDRVLKQEEALPPHYDKEEFEQWMHTFPNVSIFDQMMPYDDKLLFSGSSSTRKCNAWTIHNQTAQSVINVSEFSYNRLLMQKTATKRRRHLEDLNGKNQNIFTISNKPKGINSDKFLRVVPIKKQTERKLSTKSLKGQQNSEEYADLFPPHYDSLPFIEINEIYRDNRKSSSNIRNKNKFTHQSNLEKRTERLRLPPIQGDKLRSISATPAQDKSTFFLL